MKGSLSRVILSAAQEATRPLRHRIRALATRALIQLVNDATGVQTVQVTALSGETLDQVQRLQQFGFTGNPPAGSTAVMICIGGSRAHALIIACDDPATRYRQLAAGESAQYNAYGDFIVLKENGEIHVKARTKVTSDAPLTHALGDAEVDGNGIIHGNLQVDGDIQAGGQVTAAGAIESLTSIADPAGTMAEMRGVFNAHTQPVSGGTATAPTTPMG